MSITTVAAMLVSGHPTTGAYSADNQTAADQMNAPNLPADGSVGEFVRYLAINRSRSNDGADTQVTAMLGRLLHVAESAVGSDPFGRIVFALSLEQKHAAMMFAGMIGNPNLGALDFNDGEIDAAFSALGQAGGAEVWKNADIAALKALSNNLQSHATQQGVGRVTARMVERARA